jgi:hypothetical protein
VLIGTDFTGSCKVNSHTITTMTLLQTAINPIFFILILVNAICCLEQRISLTCNSIILNGNHVINKLYFDFVLFKYPSPWTWFELTTLVVIGIDFTGSCKVNSHTITTMTCPFVSLKQPFTLNNIICSKKGHYEILDNEFGDWYVMCLLQTAINPIFFILILVNAICCLELSISLTRQNKNEK